MELSKYVNSEPENPAEEAPKLSKEEYAAVKKQEREEVWAEVDAKAQDVFQDGNSLKGFLDFVAQCKPQRTPNLLLLYSQNPEIRQVKTFDKWKEEKRTLKSGVHGYRFIATQDYEKDGEMRQGTAICKAYDISQIRMPQPEPPEPKSMETLMGAMFDKPEVNIQIADNLPDNVQAQYIPQKRTIYVRNGMSEAVTFHAVNRELACASLDRHDGSYSRAGVSAQAFCAAYVVAQKYGVETNGFSFDRVCEMQGNGNKDPKELRTFVNDVRTAAYTIENHMNRNLGSKEQEFAADEFTVPDEKKPKAGKAKTQPER
ncbi:MAG: ArdC family protein [Clostridium sp.]